MKKDKEEPKKEKLKKSLKEIVGILNQVWKKFISFVEIILGLFILLSIVLILFSYIGALLYRIFTAEDLFTILKSILLLLMIPILYCIIRYVSSKKAKLKQFLAKLKQFFSEKLSNIQQTQIIIPSALLISILTFIRYQDLFLKVEISFLIIKITQIAFILPLAIFLSLFLHFDEPIKRLLRKNKTMICMAFFLSFIALCYMLKFQSGDWLILSVLFLSILAVNHYLFFEKEIPKEFDNFFSIYGSCFSFSLIFLFISLFVWTINDNFFSIDLTNLTDLTIIHYLYSIPLIIAGGLLILFIFMSLSIPFLFLFNFLRRKYHETIAKVDVLRNLLLIAIMWYSVIFVFALFYSTSSAFSSEESVLLYENNSSVSPSSIDNLYFSTLISTSSSINIIPVGFGKFLTALESVVGYFLLGFTIAILASMVWGTMKR